MSGSGLFWIACGVLACLAGLRVRTRLDRGSRTTSRLDDDAVREIEESGRVSVDDDEPLNLRQITREERRFWDEERWDSSEEW